MRLLSLVATGSGPEWLVILHRLAQGEFPTTQAPLDVGFRQHSVVDPATRRVVGDCPVHGVAGEFSGLRYLLLPQVSVTTPTLYTLDMLMIVHYEGHRIEIDLEVDGTGHHGWRDGKRRRDLKMHEIRFTEDQVLSPGFNTLFATTLLQRVQEITAR